MTLLCPEAERLYALADRLEREGHKAAAARYVAQAGQEAARDMARVRKDGSEDGQDDRTADR